MPLGLTVLLTTTAVNTSCERTHSSAVASISVESLSSCHDHHLTTVMQPPEGVQVDLGKAQVIDRVPKVIKELKFGVL